MWEKKAIQEVRKIREIDVLPGVSLTLYRDDDGEFWFDLTEAARALKYANPSVTVKQFIDSRSRIIPNFDELQGVKVTLTPGGRQRKRFFKEEALYLFFQYSDKEEAVLFQAIVAKVMKELRRKGHVSVDDFSSSHSSAIQLFSPKDLQAIREASLLIAQMAPIVSQTIRKVREIELKITEVEQVTQQLQLAVQMTEASFLIQLQDEADRLARKTGVSHGKAMSRINRVLLSAFPYTEVRPNVAIYRQIKPEDRQKALEIIRRYVDRIRDLSSFYHGR